MKWFLKDILADAAKLSALIILPMAFLGPGWRPRDRIVNPPPPLSSSQRHPPEDFVAEQTLGEETAETRGDSVEMEDVPMTLDRDEDEKSGSDPPLRRPMRQMRLDFSNGTMSTKTPFRNPISRKDSSRRSLADVAAETWRLLPGLLQTRPDVGTDGYLVLRESLDARFCPRLPPVRVRVINSDTIDAALAIQAHTSSTQSVPPPAPRQPVAILNMANAKSAGGGWKHGALAQEEAICYRTSLALTLKRKDYPIPDDAAIYSSRVLVIRDSITNGHDVLDCTDPRKLAVISVISCAAVCQPSLRSDSNTGRKTYTLSREKRLMAEKMRIILRTAIRRRHRQLILGAFGCGAFGNPNTEVASLWKEILQEPEFGGGWWEDVVFAVLGDASTATVAMTASVANSNFRVFYNELDGLRLS